MRNFGEKQQKIQRFFTEILRLESGAKHGACSCPGWGPLVFPLGLAGARLSSPQASALFTGILADLLPSLSLSQHFGEMLLSQCFFVSNVAFAGVCHISLPFLALLFVRFFCRRLFAKFFDLRSWLSVSLPLRSVGTPSSPPRESCFYKPRNNLEPCTDSLELC